MDPVELRTGAWLLRVVRPDDAPALVAALDDPEIRRWLWAYQVADEAAARAFAGHRAWQWLKDERYSWAVFAADGALAGEVGLRDLSAHDRSAEVACWTAAAFRGRGVAATAVSAAVAFGFGVAGLHRVGYRHAVANTASRRVAEKCGFRPEGTLRGAEWIDGRPHDLCQWSVLATD
ncbi:GNAT family N-acetyltransferase [Saccharothrix violaceirubra]|uniref:RimJ/RimL family protein N-acetyltransferase n=1 Tax=Saccharothrix violaceirubra TaxID=413306 RepID=A0A7W7SY96_9PSEU|nr:GNAT family protein [Saccharothrix violaceirubra]MBB4963113.1 RimJ/RimL family protein N-acetyltransferase [Saccharothrix violaceirubra]